MKEEYLKPKCEIEEFKTVSVMITIHRSHGDKI